MAAIKIGTQGLAPIFMAGIRSLVASVCLFIWMAMRGIPTFPDRATVMHGVMVGILFGTEFGFIYLGLNYTLASRSYVLLYTHPFFVALGAHWFLRGDRLNTFKVGGLILAFGGVMSLFMEGLGRFSLETLPGDLMLLAAGCLWGATTVYIKRFLADRALAIQVLFFQLLFSAPLLFLLSLALEKRAIYDLSGAVLSSLIYQCIIVAFLSYLVWFELIQRHPVSLLAAFTFFTPVFGVFLSGALVLREAIPGNMILGLVLVSLGMVLVNRHPGTRKMP